MFRNKPRQQQCDFDSSRIIFHLIFKYREGIRQSRRQGRDGAGDRTHSHQRQRWQDDIAFRDMARKQEDRTSGVVD